MKLYKDDKLFYEDDKLQMSTKQNNWYSSRTGPHLYLWVQNDIVPKQITYTHASLANVGGVSVCELYQTSSCPFLNY